MALAVPFYVRRPSHPLGNLSLLASQLRTPRRTASALTDNFDDNSRDTAKWAPGQYKSPTAVTTGVTVSETNARVEVTPATSSSALAYSGYLSLAAYDLTNDSIFCKITSSAALPSTVEAYIGAGQDINNLYLAIISNGSVLLQKVVAGSASNDASFAYNSSTHAWLRLRHDGTTVYIDTAPSSASDPPISSDWTNQVSAARNAAIVLSNSILALGAGTYLSTATPPTVYFDGFNTGTTPIIIHDATGVLAGAGSAIAGTAVYNAVHPTTGTLTGPDSTIAGSAARTREHATTGVLTGPGTSLVGVAVYNAKHATSGSLTGQGSSIVGSAARTREHSTTGVLTGPGSALSGASVYNAKHTTTGALTGQLGSISATATRFRAFATTGALVGPGSTIAGAADHLASTAGIHATSGGLVGQGSILAGTASRLHEHASSGILAGSASIIAGNASRRRDHSTSGSLPGVVSVVFASTFNGRPQIQDISVSGEEIVPDDAPPSATLGDISVPSGQIVNAPPYPEA